MSEAGKNNRTTARRSTEAIADLSLPFAGVAWLFLRPTEKRVETPTEAAHRICEDCGLGVDEIDGFIANWRQSSLSRDVALEAPRATFDRPADAAFCEDCAVAVLDAAGKSG